jgi:hypothetical protein
MWASFAIATWRQSKRPKEWQEMTRRGGWTWKFSRLDVLLYGNVLMTVVYLVGMAILRTSETTEKMGENTKRMGGVIEKMNDSTEQSLLVLAAMREEADAARRETSAAQKLAIRVAVITGVLGAVLGGVAGAFAAKVIGS